MQIQPPRHQPVPSSAQLLHLAASHPAPSHTLRHALCLLRSSRRQTPLLICRLHQLPTSRNPRQLLQQQPPLAPTTQPQLPNQLFISRPMSRPSVQSAASSHDQSADKVSVPSSQSIQKTKGPYRPRRSSSRPKGGPRPIPYAERYTRHEVPAPRAVNPSPQDNLLTRLRHLRRLLQSRASLHLHKLCLHLILLLPNVLKEQAPCPRCAHASP